MIFTKDTSKKSGGFVTLEHGVILDAEDVHLISGYKIYISKSGYPLISKNRKYYIISRIILDVKDPNLKVDHINRNPLDNRKSNLRICSASENNRNRSNFKNSKVKYKGVVKCTLFKEPRYRARISINKKTICLGRYRTAKEAALAYDKAAKKYFKEFAVLNFPDEGSQNK